MVRSIARGSVIAAVALACCSAGSLAFAADPSDNNNTNTQTQTTAAADETGNKCGVSSIAGDFGFQAQGTRNQGRRQQVYYVVRTANFDGNGKTTGKGMANVGGKITTYQLDGSYSIGDDCSITIDATQTFGDSKPEPYKQFGVLVNGGDEILAIQTSAGGRTQVGRYEKY